MSLKIRDTLHGASDFAPEDFSGSLVRDTLDIPGDIALEQLFDQVNLSAQSQDAHTGYTLQEGWNRFAWTLPYEQDVIQVLYTILGRFPNDLDITILKDEFGLSYLPEYQFIAPGLRFLPGKQYQVKLPGNSPLIGTITFPITDKVFDGTQSTGFYTDSLALDGTTILQYNSGSVATSTGNIVKYRDRSDIISDLNDTQIDIPAGWSGIGFNRLAGFTPHILSAIQSASIIGFPSTFNALNQITAQYPFDGNSIFFNTTKPANLESGIQFEYLGKKYTPTLISLTKNGTQYTASFNETPFNPPDDNTPNWIPIGTDTRYQSSFYGYQTNLPFNPVTTQNNTSPVNTYSWINQPQLHGKLSLTESYWRIPLNGTIEMQLSGSNQARVVGTNTNFLRDFKAGQDLYFTAITNGGNESNQHLAAPSNIATYPRDHFGYYMTYYHYKPFPSYTYSATDAFVPYDESQLYMVHVDEVRDDNLMIVSRFKNHESHPEYPDDDFQYGERDYTLAVSPENAFNYVSSVRNSRLKGLHPGEDSSYTTIMSRLFHRQVFDRRNIAGAPHFYEYEAYQDIIKGDRASLPNYHEWTQKFNEWIMSPDRSRAEVVSTSPYWLTQKRAFRFGVESDSLTMHNNFFVTASNRTIHHELQYIIPADPVNRILARGAIFANDTWDWTIEIPSTKYRMIPGATPPGYQNNNRFHRGAPYIKFEPQTTSDSAPNYLPLDVDAPASLITPEYATTGFNLRYEAGFHEAVELTHTDSEYSYKDHYQRGNYCRMEEDPLVSEQADDNDVYSRTPRYQVTQRSIGIHYGWEWQKYRSPGPVNPNTGRYIYEFLILDVTDNKLTMAPSPWIPPATRYDLNGFQPSAVSFGGNSGVSPNLQQGLADRGHVSFVDATNPDYIELHGTGFYFESTVPSYGEVILRMPFSLYSYGLPTNLDWDDTEHSIKDLVSLNYYQGKNPWIYVNPSVWTHKEEVTIGDNDYCAEGLHMTCKIIEIVSDDVIRLAHPDVLCDNIRFDVFRQRANTNLYPYWLAGEKYIFTIDLDHGTDVDGKFIGKATLTNTESQTLFDTGDLPDHAIPLKVGETFRFAAYVNKHERSLDLEIVSIDPDTYSFTFTNHHASGFLIDPFLIGKDWMPGYDHPLFEGSGLIVPGRDDINNDVITILRQVRLGSSAYDDAIYANFPDAEPAITQPSNYQKRLDLFWGVWCSAKYNITTIFKQRAVTASAYFNPIQSVPCYVPERITTDITDDLVIMKDDQGMSYLPEYDYFGFANLTPGLGYQIKTRNPINGFKWPTASIGTPLIDD